MNLLKTYLILLLFGASTIPVSAQMLSVNPDTKNDYLFTTLSHFNPLFVNRNNLKSVRVEVSYKRDGDPIIKTNLFHLYEFDRNGRLVSQIETYKKSLSEIDSSLIRYYYNKDNNIVKEERRDAKGNFKYVFNYNKNELSRKTYYREKKLDSVNTKDIIVYEEGYSWDTLSYDSLTEIVGYVYNDIGKKYKKYYWVYSKSGSLLVNGSKLLMNSFGSEKRYFYDQFGRVYKIEKRNLSDESKKETTNFFYDDEGHLLEERTKIKNILKNRSEYMYDEALMVDTQLLRDEETNTIHIYKLTYLFY